MNKQRLLRVAEVLEGVPDERFDLGVWMKTDSECGTVGCAVGHYIERNPDCGLKLVRCEGSICFDITGGVFESFSAVERHFDIDETQFNMLFTEHGYGPFVTKQVVIDCIRSFVKANEVEQQISEAVSA